MLVRSLIILLVGISLSAEARPLKVVTFNTWFLRVPQLPFADHDYSAKLIEDRLALLPEALHQKDADILFLQELWEPSEKNALRKAMQELKYLVVMGKQKSGLAILIRKEILSPETEIEFQEKQFEGKTRVDEYFVQKGVQHTVISTKEHGKMHLFNAHLVAIDFDADTQKFDRDHLNFHDSQMLQLKNFVLEKTKEDDLPVVMGADLNMHFYPWDIETGKRDTTKLSASYQKLLKACQLTDTMRVEALQTLPPDQDFTYDSKSNPYIKMGNFPAIPPETVDYLFTKGFAVHASSLVFTQEYEGETNKLFLSDHYGVEADLSN